MGYLGFTNNAFHYFKTFTISSYHHIFNKLTNHLLWILHLTPSDHISILDVGLPPVLVKRLEEPRNWLGTHLPTSSQNLSTITITTKTYLSTDIPDITCSASGQGLLLPSLSMLASLAPAFWEPEMSHLHSTVQYCAVQYNTVQYSTCAAAPYAPTPSTEQQQTGTGGWS